MASVKKAPSFESELLRLENTAQEMEKGDLPLEKLMSLYEQGMEAAAALEKRLQAAQQRMLEIRADRDGAPVAAPMEAAEQTSLWEDKP